MGRGFSSDCAKQGVPAHETRDLELPRGCGGMDTTAGTPRVESTTHARGLGAGAGPCRVPSLSLSLYGGGHSTAVPVRKVIAEGTGAPRPTVFEWASATLALGGSGDGA